MRKIKTLFPILLYSLGHAALVSLGAVCFLNVAAITLSPFGSTGSYPRFLPFCVIVGILAFAAWVILFVLNARHLLNHDTHLRRKIALEVVLTVFLTLPGMWLWDNLFCWLQKLL